MTQRLVFALMLVMMIVITALAIFFVSSALSGMQSVAQLVAPSPTPTPLPPTPTPTPVPFISGAAAYLIDADTGRVLYNLNSLQQLPIGSTTKIMTAIVAIENANLEQGVTVEQSDLDQVPPGASSAGLVSGDYFRLRTLLFGLMLRS